VGGFTGLTDEYQMIAREQSLLDERGGPPLMGDSTRQRSLGFEHAMTRGGVLESSAHDPEKKAVHRASSVTAFRGGEVDESQLGMLHQRVQIMHEPPKHWVGKDGRGKTTAHQLSLPQRSDQDRSQLIQLLLRER
jgi:hypothetical protein